MTECVDLTRLGAALGDSARANMLLALFRIPALTATELANEGGVTRATASTHLRKLQDEGLLRVRPVGRHRYFELADGEVAFQLEQLLGFVKHLSAIRSKPGPSDPLLRRARRCYDHFAGEVAVTLFERLSAGGAFDRAGDGLVLTEKGKAMLARSGVDTARFGRSRVVCRECLDWSQRRPHLGGSAGAALLERIISLGWVLQTDNSRAMTITARGELGFKSLFLA